MSENTNPGTIVMSTGPADEMLRIAQDGFYVRGKKVPVDENEARVVYEAFRQWVVWANLQR